MIKYRLTQRRLLRKLAEANVLIERLLSKGLVPDLTLHPVLGNPLARTVASHRVIR